ncbi:DRTGG domain-containing protein [Haliovirga abyssi]|uniref:DRTGG domain-containing protein n=1 Tax=Haliovirga abyssi TaxID=2996794 RepID=A0AAU9DH10_9FUSO|nr:DRTGG domain-containing protein [Haliovirga abyssi]BDU49994.1 hypothetical protein HLVA_05630 [Haliovirga abyssi]
MKLKEIMELIDAEIIVGEEYIKEMDIKHVGAADLMSEVLAFAKEDSLLLTGLTTPQIIRTAQMMDLAVIVLVRGKIPQQDTINLAKEVGIPVLTTKELLYTACGKLYNEKLESC